MSRKEDGNSTKETDETDVLVENTSSFQKAINQIKKIFGNVTLEPMLFLKMMAEGNFRVVGDTLEIDRVCRINLNYSHEDCLMMDDGNHSTIQEAVQIYQNTFNYYQSLMDSILPVIVILFAGSMSDQYGRKPPMGAVLAGFVALSLVYVLTAANPSWPVEVLYAGTFAVDITGSWVVFNMAVYSYMADVTKIESRTKRMGWLDAVWYTGGPIGTWIGGWLYQTSGFIAVFAVSAVLWFICLIYLIFVVKESLIERRPKEKPFRSVVDMTRVTFKEYPNRGRTHLLALMAIKLGVSLTQGHQVYLWARRVLGWDATQYSTWSGADEAVHQFGMVVWVGMASYYHLSDHTVAATGLVSIALWSITLACISGPSLWWLVIIASLFGSLEASIEPALRTLITSIPEKADVGKILAFLGLMEAIWLIVDRSFYTFLYNSFVDSFPQVNLIVQSVIAIILFVGILVMKSNWSKRQIS